MNTEEEEEDEEVLFSGFSCINSDFWRCRLILLAVTPAKSARPSPPPPPPPPTQTLSLSLPLSLSPRSLSPYSRLLLFFLLRKPARNNEHKTVNASSAGDHSAKNGSHFPHRLGLLTWPLTTAERTLGKMHRRRFSMDGCATT